MARGMISDTLLTNIADAIRSKTGTTNNYTPAEMPAAINNIVTSSNRLDVSLLPGIAFGMGGMSKDWIWNNLDFSKVNSMSRMFYSSSISGNLDGISFPNGNYFYQTFYSTWLSNIDGLDIPKAEYMHECFSRCSELTSVSSNFNAHNLKRTSGMFEYCSYLASVNNIDMSTVTQADRMFGACKNLTDIGALDCSNLIYFNLFDTYYTQQYDIYTTNLVNLGGFINIGNNYALNENTLNYRCEIPLSEQNNLTYSSLINVIDGLYNIANKGINTQRLRLGSNLLNLLSSDEIAEATNKGWTVS